MTIRSGILLLGLLICFGCNKSTPPPDPRIAELEAEIKKLKAGDKTVDAGKKAMRELKKMNSIIEMGINYPDYTKTLVEAKPVFDEAIADVPEGNLKTALSTAMKAYIDAGRFWNISLQRVSPEGFAHFQYDEKGQFSTYELEWETEGYSLKIGQAYGLKKIWAVAAVSLLAAEELIKQETAK